MITADEVAKILGISRGAVYDLAAPKGALPCARFGPRCIRFNVEDVEAFKQLHMVSAPAVQPRVKTPLPTRHLEVSDPFRRNYFERMGIPTKPKLKAKGVK